MILPLLRRAFWGGLILAAGAAACADQPATPVTTPQAPSQQSPPEQTTAQQAGDQKAADQKAGDQKGGDPRAGEEKAGEKKAGNEKSKLRFMRIRRDAKGQPLALETPIIRFAPNASASDADGDVRVDLIGAVHVGERSYYQQLNQLFTEYDALLYELVAPQNQRPVAGERSGVNPLRGMQVGMKSLLNLEFQLDQIDYSKKNFVHADMSPREFAQSMTDRDESFLQMYFRMIGQGIAQQSKDPTRSSDVELMMAMFAPDRAMRLKRLMAEQFASMDGQLAAINGKEGSTLITERNKKALDVLKRELAADKKKIGVFYGAGHLSDMEARLVQDFQMKRESVKWITAWSLKSSPLRVKSSGK